ncbi:MAG: dTDP-4-dehydrorhamnose reductase [Gammaproteobacteria bacterium]|nr:dTDP-4-dehydrorhamnose reductase [Gammaproteobacteria bacterium]
MQPLELWGGVECTVNRIGVTWTNQLERTGHLTRESDLDLIAELGIRTVRYPVLWELTAPESLSSPRWVWADERLRKLSKLQIMPVIGLVHHGSGPAYTDLLDENFAPLLAEFARKVAERYPWVTGYTPINEPLTTARFSGLYGHWYPHGRDDRTFARAFVNQCRGIALAMRAIRTVNPLAQLIQTEDLGTTFSTHPLQYQSDFDNQRRWLTWDLLCGHVTKHHPLSSFLSNNGIAEPELAQFVDDPCPPQIIGMNHYVTSDRYLDHRVEGYPSLLVGGNSRDRYVDVEAVRVLPGSYGGWRVIPAAWNRYRIPVALTEVHLGCSEFEQARWFRSAWIEAAGARRKGVDVRAITAWSLFGSYDWDTLMTKNQCHYEAGAFDVRSSPPRRTLLGETLRTFVGDAVPPNDEGSRGGWWENPMKTIYSPPSTVG